MRPGSTGKTYDKNEWECLGNTSERPLVVAAAKAGLVMEQVEKEYQPLKENPFSSSRKMMSTLVKSAEGSGCVHFPHHVFN